MSGIILTFSLRFLQMEAKLQQASMVFNVYCRTCGMQECNLKAHLHRANAKHSHTRVLEHNTAAVECGSNWHHFPNGRFSFPKFNPELKYTGKLFL